MSRHNYESFSLDIPCPYCGAVGWCVTTSGAKATFLHADRTEPFRECWNAGFEAGEEEERIWPKVATP